MKIENIKYFDCHSHPHDKKFLEAGVNQDEMMQELRKDGGATIAIGTDYTETQKAIEFAKKYENCWATIGIHPADNHKEIFDEAKLERLLISGQIHTPGGVYKKVIGVGECGLDYFYFDKNYLNLPILEKEKRVDQEKTRQKELFVKQVEFAIKHDLPLVIHGRPSRNSMDAYRDILDILESFQLPFEQEDSSVGNKLKGHAHFFVGNLEIAKRFLDLGFYISFDGPVTFTTEYDNVIKFVPMEKILIETDAPYAAPMPYRGQLNHPKYVKEVAKKIANLKDISVEEVLETTKNNTIKLFGLDKE